MKLNEMLLAAAISGLVVGVTGCGESKPANTGGATAEPSSGGGTTTPATPAAHACKGQNACKGQGGCKDNAAGCKGKNACKGQGGCKAE